jgi:hypothetical protein
MNYPYTFGYIDGISPETSAYIQVENEFDILMQRILTPREYMLWKNKKLYMQAIEDTVDSIIERGICTNSTL